MRGRHRARSGRRADAAPTAPGILSRQAEAMDTSASATVAAGAIALFAAACVAEPDRDDGRPEMAESADGGISVEVSPERAALVATLPPPARPRVWGVTV